MQYILHAFCYLDLFGLSTTIPNVKSLFVLSTNDYGNWSTRDDI